MNAIRVTLAAIASAATVGMLSPVALAAETQPGTEPAPAVQEKPTQPTPETKPAERAPGAQPGTSINDEGSQPTPNDSAPKRPKQAQPTPSDDKPSNGGAQPNPGAAQPPKQGGTQPIPGGTQAAPSETAPETPKPAPQAPAAPASDPWFDTPTTSKPRVETSPVAPAPAPIVVDQPAAAPVAEPVTEPKPQNGNTVIIEIAHPNGTTVLEAFDNARGQVDYSVLSRDTHGAITSRDAVTSVSTDRSVELRRGDQVLAGAYLPEPLAAFAHRFSGDAQVIPFDIATVAGTHTAQVGPVGIVAQVKPPHDI